MYLKEDASHKSHQCVYDNTFTNIAQKQIQK